MIKVLLRFFLVLFFFLMQGHGHLYARIINSNLHFPVKIALAKQTTYLSVTPNSHSTSFETTKEKELVSASTDIFEEENDDDEVSVRKYIATGNYFINYFCIQAQQYYNSFLAKRLQCSRHLLFPSNTNRYIMLCVIRI